MKPLILILILLFNQFAFAETHNHKAHVHGAAKLTLAIEDDTHASIDLDVAGDSIMGFEYTAKTEADKKAKDKGFEKLPEQGGFVMMFDPKLKCNVVAEKVEIEKEDVSGQSNPSEHGQHSDVNASYKVNCDKPLSGSSVHVGLGKLFPKIKKVSLQILTTNKQTSSEIKDEHDSVQIP